MENSVYHINKGVNRSIEFKGLRAQYIWYLGIGVVGLLVLFIILYFCGVNTYVCLVIIVISAFMLFKKVYQLNNKYGEHGMMKKLARRKIPRLIQCNSRKVFFKRSAL